MEQVIPFLHTHRNIVEFHDHTGDPLREDKRQDGVQEHIILKAVREDAVKKHKGKRDHAEVWMRLIQPGQDRSRKGLRLDNINAERFQPAPQITLHQQ